ncbi:hypothetical protein [Hylemonella gracilis]|nr:hypothetical protein [Hylemonella gracilis]
MKIIPVASAERPFIFCITLAAMLVLSACGSNPKDSPASQNSASEEKPDQSSSVKLLDELSERDRRLCIFDRAKPPAQRYQVIQALKPIFRGIGVATNTVYVPKLIQQATELNADALISYDSVLYKDTIGAPHAFVTGQAIRWHQPTNLSCQELGGMTAEEMLQKNLTSAGNPVLPFRRVGGLIDAMLSTPLQESGVILLKSSKGKPQSVEAVRGAILKAAADVPWTVKRDESGQLHLQNSWKRFGKSFDLVLSVTYDAESFEVKYLDSNGLGFDPKTRIASNAVNDSIANLVKGTVKAYAQ